MGLVEHTTVPNDVVSYDLFNLFLGGSTRARGRLVSSGIIGKRSGHENIAACGRDVRLVTFIVDDSSRPVVAEETLSKNEHYPTVPFPEVLDLFFT